jgi:tetratricopeptide (TPR) repeat protein
MISRLVKIIGGALLGLSIAVRALAGPPITKEQRGAFKRLFGDEQAQVDKSNDRNKHFAFGKKLFEESQKPKNPLEEVLEENAIKHLKRSGKNEGYEMVLAIHKDDISDFPEDKVEYLRLMLNDAKELLKRIPFKEKKKKSEIQTFIADTYFALADALEQQGDYEGATKKFNDAVNTYRFARKYDKSRESANRAKENSGFKVLQTKLKNLEGLVKKGDKKANLELGLEMFKKGEYEKAKECFSNGDNAGAYLAVTDFLTSNPNERVTPKGVKESQVKELVDKISKRDSKGLIDIIGELTAEPELEAKAVVSAGMVHYDNIDWNYLRGFGNDVSAYMGREGRASGFNLEKSLKAARLFDELAKDEKRRYVRAGLLKGAFDLYTLVSKKAEEGSIEAAEAKKMVASLEKELEKYKGVKVKGLELAEEQPSFRGPKGCVLYMPFDKNTIVRQGNKLIIRDLSGNGHDGAVYGAKLVKGKVGEGLSFDGKDDYVDLGKPDSLNFKGSDSFTICVWVKVEGTYRVHLPFVMKGDRQFGLKSKNNLFRFFVYDTTWQEAIADTTITLNQWYHLVGRVSGSELTLSVNGKKQIDTGTIHSKINDDGHDVNIGRNSQSNNFFNGIIDEVRVYNKALLKEEIKFLYNHRNLNTRPKK